MVMAIFGRSKKGRETISQRQSNPTYDSQLNSNYQYDGEPLNTSYSNNIQSNGYSNPPPNAWEIPCQPIHITQNFLIASPLLERPQTSCKSPSMLDLGSVSNLLSRDVSGHVLGTRVCNNGQSVGIRYPNQGVALCDLISSKFDAVITLIDGENFNGDERELVVLDPPQWCWQEQPQDTSQDLARSGKSKGVVDRSLTSNVTYANHFMKANLYANSRLPPNLPPMKLYMPTFPLLCLAARYSEAVYEKPKGQEKETHVEADWRLGTKAMVIKSVPMDDMNTIVFAIRGTQTFMDWAVNLNSSPASPEGFLDDVGNLCHAGFLCQAKKMIKPVASRLRFLLQEQPGRVRYSLVITGHSAGGAIAALLYSHMLSTSKETDSELNALTGCFKRVHCITFGAPPITLLPLAKPHDPSLRKSLFMSFVNEGDPVTRVDKSYFFSLLECYASPAPNKSQLHNLKSQKSNRALAISKKSALKISHSAPQEPSIPLWPVPEATLSNAGRLIMLRSVERPDSRSEKKRDVDDRMNDGVVAQTISDELLRGVIWGDPICHMMRLYARRIEVLATNAVMGRF